MSPNEDPVESPAYPLPRLVAICIVSVASKTWPVID